MSVHLDFETRSELDVKKVGAYAYARHPSTSLLCLAYAVDDHPVISLTEDQIHREHEDCEELVYLSEIEEIVFKAHNAFFEQCIWKFVMERLGFNPMPIKRWQCTAAKAAYMGLPRNLDGVSKALELPFQKDVEGNRIMLKLSRPRARKLDENGNRIFWTYEDKPDEFDRVYEYNITDVETEREVDKALPDLSQREQRIWYIDQEINFRGVQVDLPFVHKVTDFIDLTTEDLLKQFREITQGEVDKPTQREVFLNWLTMNGLCLPNLQAATVTETLAKDEYDENLPTIKALKLRQQLSKISSSKYDAILKRLDMSDHRLKDILLYCAAITHRWGGRGVQVHNMPRGTVDSDTAIQILMNSDYEFFSGAYEDLFDAYSSMVRGSFISAPDCDLFVADFSAVEAVSLNWEAGCDNWLKAFADGEDAYCKAASHIYDKEITKEDKDERLVGKVSELAFGYGGGIGAYESMGKAYNVDLKPVFEILWPSTTEDERKKARNAYNLYLGRQKAAGNPEPLDKESAYAADIIKQRWRLSNQSIVRYWAHIEEAAIQAVMTGQKQYVGSYDLDFSPGGTIERPTIIYGMLGSDLLCKLPSGNCIVYPSAKLSKEETAWGTKKLTLSYKAQNETNWQYGRTWTYGGKLVENITQAIARDLLADAIIRIDEAGYPIVMHIHDEIVAEVHRADQDRLSLERFEKLMSHVPDWASGMPLKVEAWKGTRYKKS